MMKTLVFFAAAAVLLPITSAFAVDRSTLTGKLVVGYQGWQNTPSDGSSMGWTHWSNDRSDVSDSGTVHFERLPGA